MMGDDYVWSVTAGDAVGSKLVIRRRKSCQEAETPQESPAQRSLHPRQYHNKRYFPKRMEPTAGENKSSVDSLRSNSTPNSITANETFRTAEAKNESNTMKKLDWILTRFQPKITDLFRDESEEAKDRTTHNSDTGEIENSGGGVQKKKKKIESSNKETDGKIINVRKISGKEIPRKKVRSQKRFSSRDVKSRDTANEARNKEVGETTELKRNQTPEDNFEIQDKNMPRIELRGKPEEIIIVHDDIEMESSRDETLKLSKNTSNVTKLSGGNKVEETLPVRVAETGNNIPSTFNKKCIEGNVTSSDTENKKKDKNSEVEKTEGDDDVIIVENTWDLIVIDDDD